MKFLKILSPTWLLWKVLENAFHQNEGGERKEEDMEAKKKKIQSRREVKEVQDSGQGKTLDDTTGCRGCVRIRAHQKALVGILARR